VAILPTPGVEEQEPMAVETMASTSTEVRDAVIERLSPPEFASETYDRAESTPYPRSLEATGAEQAADVSPAASAGETVPGQPIGGEPGPASQALSPHGAPPSESVHQVSEKPANPRRGWWQRFIPS
jgi:hypothetical protein